LDLKPGDQVTHLTLPWEAVRPTGSKVPAAQGETANEGGAAGKTSQRTPGVSKKSPGKTTATEVVKTAGKLKSPPAKRAAAVKKTVSSRKPTAATGSKKQPRNESAKTQVKSSPERNQEHPGEIFPTVPEKKGTAPGAKRTQT
jgi:hypothetical protein